MNRSKKQLTKQAQKGVKKAVRKAQSSYKVIKKKDEGDVLTAKEMRLKFPKKPLSKQKANLPVKKKAAPVKKVVKKGGSKRTAPGTTLSQSAPAFAHREGERWIKTINTQQQINRKIQTRKAIKK